MSDPRESAVEGVLTSVRWQHRSDGRVALVLILDDGVRMATGNCPPEMQAEAHRLLNARVIVHERDGKIVGVSRATQPPAVETDAAYRERLFASGLAAHAHDALLTRLHTSCGAALDKAGLALGLCRLPAPKEPPPMVTYPRLRFRHALECPGVLTEGRIADVGGSVADVLLADGRVLELDVGGSAEAREALTAMARASVRLCVQVEGATIHSLEPLDLAQQTRGASGVPIELAALGAVSRAPVLTDEPLTLEVPDAVKGRGRGTVVGQLAASGPTGVLLSVLGTDRQQGLSVEWTDEARAWAQAAKRSTVCVHHVGGWAYSIEVVKAVPAAVPAAAPASLAIGGERVVLEPDDPTARDQLAALAARPGLLGAPADVASARTLDVLAAAREARAGTDAARRELGYLHPVPRACAEPLELAPPADAPADGRAWTATGWPFAVETDCFSMAARGGYAPPFLFAPTTEARAWLTAARDARVDVRVSVVGKYVRRLEVVPSLVPTLDEIRAANEAHAARLVQPPSAHAPAAAEAMRRGCSTPAEYAALHVHINGEISRAVLGDMAASGSITGAYPPPAFTASLNPPAPAPKETAPMPYPPVNPTDAIPTDAAESTRLGRLKATLTTDATDAGYRVAAGQVIKLARAPLCALLQRHVDPDDDTLRVRLASFFETELGGAILASLLSLGVGALPGATGPTAERLSRELRVRAMSDMGDLVASVIVGPFTEVVATFLRDPGGMVTATPPAELAEGLPGRLGEVRAAVREASGG